MYDQQVALTRQPTQLHRSLEFARTTGRNVPTIRRPARPAGRNAYCLRSPSQGRALRVHPKDRFERKPSRFWGWDIPAMIGLAGSLGTPGIGLASASMTSACWGIALGGSGLSHMANAVSCRRRRSMSSGLVFVTLAVLGITYGTDSTSAASWDNVWFVAFLVWAFWFLHDRRRPSRRYLRT
jgi:hypothetical protein